MASQINAPDTSVDCVVITQTKEQILQRMAAGERLRWIPRSMLGLDKPYMPKVRELLLGKNMLCEESIVDAMELVIDGKIDNIEDEDTGICDYVLS
jgi:hypothetical protein